MLYLFRFGPYVLDSEQHVLLRAGQRIALPPKVLETLQILVSAQGRVVSKAEFMTTLWPSLFVEDSNLTQNIFVLRRALGTTESGQTYIETIPKLGYRLTVPVEENKPADEPHCEPPPVAPAVGPAPQHPYAWRDRAGLTLVAAGIVAVLCLLGLAVASRGRPRPELRELAAKRLTDDRMPKNLAGPPTPMVSDGVNLFFTERRDNRTVLAQVPVKGGSVTVHPGPLPDAILSDYSRLRHSLLIGSVWRIEDTNPLMVEDVKTGRVGALGAVRAHDASWSPDGALLAFTRAGSLAVAKADGTDERQIAKGGGVIFWPRWSPDGRRLRYSENYGSNRTELWEVDADGGNLHLLLASESARDHVCCGMWSGDGRWYFYNLIMPGQSSIWALPEDGGRNAKPLQVIPSHDMEWQGPLVNQDGRKLWAVGSDRTAELVRVDPKTRALQPYMGGISAEGVSFAPDGETLAYTAFPEGTLWIVRKDGSGRRQITQRPEVARFPHWSPDGRKLVFVAGKAGSPWLLYMLDVPSGTVRPLLHDKKAQGVASWSPDGSMISFGRLPDYSKDNASAMSVQIYDLAHDSLRMLPGSQGLWTPRWSPDGRYLAAVTTDNGALRLCDLHTGRWSDLVKMGANDMVWSPDSQYLFFDTVLGTTPALYRVRIANKRLEMWADLRGLNRAGFYGPWLGMLPGGEPILLRDRTIEEVYEFSLQVP